MSYDSRYIKATFQETNDNPNSWGQILTDSALALLEDSVAGAATITLVSTADFPLDDTAGSTVLTSARHMILNVDGSPGGTTNIIAPSTQVVGNPSPRPRTKMYLVNNQVTDSSDVVLKTDAGGSVGATVPAGQARWVYIDGTDGVVVEATVSLATDSAALGGSPAATYARLDQGAGTQSFTAGQVVVRVALPEGPTAPDYRPDLALSNAFFHETSGGEVMNLRTPTNPVDGGQFSLVIRQGTGGGTISFADSAYAFAGGAAPSLTVGIGSFDYLAFEYSSNLTAWIGSIQKNVSIV